MARASIYTRKGDSGETGLVDGMRVPKSDVLIEAIGVVDELNAQIGVAITQIQDTRLKVQVRKLEEIQGDLFAIGAQLAGYQDNRKIVNSQKWERRVEMMETEIDQMWGEMPPLKNFILPRGQIHLARTVCRRAERRICAVPIIHNTYPMILVYLNRLSDYLFCLARWVNFKAGEKETIWTYQN